MKRVSPSPAVLPVTDNISIVKVPVLVRQIPDLNVTVLTGKLLDLLTVISP